MPTTHSDRPRGARTATSIEPWHSLHEFEGHLRACKPIMHHADVDTSMLPYYDRVARSEGYDLSAHGTPLRGVATVILVRREVPGRAPAA